MNVVLRERGQLKKPIRFREEISTVPIQDVAEVERWEGLDNRGSMPIEQASSYVPKKGDDHAVTLQPSGPWDGVGGSSRADEVISSEGDVEEDSRGMVKNTFE